MGGLYKTFKQKEITMSVESITSLSQYLTFKLDEETYALDISRVHSVLDFEKLTKVPKTPDFMRGVINLRGSVVPIIDLKLKFALEATEKTIDTCIIILEVDIDGESTVFGALADSVQEVIDIEPTDIEPPPKIGTKVNTEFIKGMGKRDEKFIILLDIDKIFSLEELEVVQGATKKSDTPKKETKKKSLSKDAEKVEQAV